MSPTLNELIYVHWLIAICLYVFQFTDFIFEGGFDYVTVRDGNNASANSLGMFSGSERPRILMSTGSHLRVLMQTDFDTNYPGFNATYFKGIFNYNYNMGLCIIGKCTLI